MDKLKRLGSQRSSSKIMSFFDGVDEEYNLQQQKSSAILKKEEYLRSHQLLETLIINHGTEYELTRIRAFGILIETTDFFIMDGERRSMIKDNMEWCNIIYEKYLDTLK